MLNDGNPFLTRIIMFHGNFMLFEAKFIDIL